MNLQGGIKRQLRIRESFAVLFLGILVSVYGAYILASTLLVQIAAHHSSRLNDVLVDIPLLIGLSLLYLGSLLRRRKRTAWFVTIMAFTFYLGVGVAQVLNRTHPERLKLHEILRSIIFPILIILLLIIFRRYYVVKSDMQGFGFAARLSVIILLSAFIYGVSGFLLLDKSDFHQEINFGSAVHYTIDQFNITTTKPLEPHTKRAHLFVDSLSFISFGAVVYVAISLFQPLRLKLSDQHLERERMKDLLNAYGGKSEEFFKLWPQDKQYFFDETGRSGLALHVSHGVALCVGSPVGAAKSYPKLMRDFTNLCFGNDWLPALVHVEDNQRNLYEKHGFVMQKLGEEAVVDIAKFKENVVGNKYFRQIGNKFAKRDYSYEILSPPHHEAIVDRLKVISDEWLRQDGRVERGFTMGYFTPEYLQMCQVMVARDAADTIQGFINLVPADFDKDEATFDMLRHTKSALGNINDYILMSLIDYLSQQGYKHLNLGLCPLVGLNDEQEDEERNKLISNILSFAYANGDRFYSFQGLYRFKAKYEPQWRNRYVAYQGGIRGFTRTMTALMRTMRV